MSQVVHLEGGLQAIFRQAPGRTKQGSIADQYVERPDEAEAFGIRKTEISMTYL